MRRLANVMAVVLLVLTTAPGNLAMCAGWKPTPEARLACCAAGAMCPMRAHHHGTVAARHAVSQQAADSCCAAADRDDAPPASAFVVPGPVPVLAAIVSPVDPRPDWKPARRAFESPPQSPGVSRHLLLTVILI